MEAQRSLWFMLEIDRHKACVAFMRSAMRDPRQSSTVLHLILPLFWLGSLIETPGEEATIEFNRDIRPILSDKCFACHGPDEKKRKAQLRLDLGTEAMRDLGGYSAIVPGKPHESALISRITSSDLNEVMPPPETQKILTNAESYLLRRWIEQGAEYQAHWAYVQPVKTALAIIPQPTGLAADSHRLLCPGANGSRRTLSIDSGKPGDPHSASDF